MTSGSEEHAREDLEATLAARRELGPGYDAALAESFVDRIDQRIAARVDALVAERGDRGAHGKRSDEASTRQFVLGIISLGTGIPITAIAGGTTDGVAGVVVAWLGIVGVNAAHAWSTRRGSH